MFRCDRAAAVVVGAAGVRNLRRGWYVYVGSAFGAGGLATRVRRHFDPTAPKRWHLDYLKPYLTPVQVWHTADPERRECAWAGLLGRGRGVAAVDAVGASDCRCPAHLLWFAGRPSVRVFRQRVKRAIPSHYPIRSVRCRRCI